MTKSALAIFHCWDRIANTVELGYDLQPNYWGKGIMTEALNSIIAFAFDKMSVDTIFAHIYPANVKSCDLAKRMGFVDNGKTTTYTFRGQDYLHIIMELTKDKFEAKQ